MAIQTITYDDKSAINVNPDIADINKVNASDMNQIKSVVNNNATETSTNTTNISNLKGTILWTNPSHSSSFSEQTITLSSDDYDYLEIFFTQGTSNTRCWSERILKGYGTQLTNTINLNAGVSQPTGTRQREVNYVNDTTLQFANALQRDDGTSASVPQINNNAIIPLYIIGYKTGLF